MNNFFSALWKIGIYVLLVVILYIVIIYKVQWEGSTAPKKYLYFYKCSDSICTTSENITGYISKYDCEISCPVVTEIIDEENVKLKYNGSEFVFNYVQGKINNGE